MREPLKFGIEFLSPWLTEHSSARKGLARSLDPFAVMGPSAETHEKIERPQLTDATPAPIFQDERAKFREDKRAHLTQKAGVLYDAVHRYLEEMHKISIIDRTNIRHPKAGQNLYGVVGPEGDLVKFMPHLKLRSLRRALATMALPIVTRQKIKTTTGDLSLGLNVPLKDARQWQVPVPGISLDPEHRYTWAVYVGRANKKEFNSTFTQGYDPFTKEKLTWTKFSEKLNKGEYDDITNEKQRRIKNKMHLSFKAKVSKNKQKAWLKMLGKFPKLKDSVRIQDRINNLQG